MPNCKTFFLILVQVSIALLCKAQSQTQLNSDTTQTGSAKSNFKTDTIRRNELERSTTYRLNSNVTTMFVNIKNRPLKLQYNFETSPGFSHSYEIFGRRDARLNYKGYQNAAAFTFLTGIFVLPGLITAIYCSQTPPALKTLNAPNPSLFKNIHYEKGYSNEAAKIKSRKVWRSFAIGVSIPVGLGLCYWMISKNMDLGTYAFNFPM